jgi:hypothetical protein
MQVRDINKNNRLYTLIILAYQYFHLCLSALPKIFHEAQTFVTFKNPESGAV